jgi:hypothetical protein
VIGGKHRSLGESSIIIIMLPIGHSSMTARDGGYCTVRYGMWLRNGYKCDNSTVRFSSIGVGSTAELQITIQNK